MGRPSTVGGPREYHDRQEKLIREINKKEKKLAHTQMLLESLL